MSETRVSGQFVAGTEEPSMIGAVLGSYRITAALDAGGMGHVYRAQHELLDRPAAIKLLRPELTTNDELVQRFVNEAKAATAIRHPGIVEIYDFGYTDEGLAYIVMEFLEGSSLGRRIDARGQFDELEAVQIARGIASALKAAHAKRIVHRDLKPDNIFLVPDPDGGDRIKVLDFGIAKLATPTMGVGRTQAGVLMGSPHYMAPEQAREAGTTDHRADLYSLGCILYELVVGRPPFVAEGAGEVIALQLFAEPEPPGQLAPISTELERLILQLLAKEPEARPASAQQVMTVLDTIAPRSSASLSTPHRRVADTGPSAVVATSGDHAIARLATLPALATLVPARPARSRMPLLAGLVTLAVAGILAAGFVITQRPAPRAPIAEPVVPVPVAVPATPLDVEPMPADPVVIEPPIAPPPLQVITIEKTIEKTVEKTVEKVVPPKAGPRSNDDSPIEEDLDAPAPKRTPRKRR